MLKYLTLVQEDDHQGRYPIPLYTPLSTLYHSDSGVVRPLSEFVELVDLLSELVLYFLMFLAKRSELSLILHL